jgi:beta-glucosidase
VKVTRRELIKSTALSLFGTGVVAAFPRNALFEQMEKFEREDELLAKMTLEEKVGQLTQFAGDFDTCKVKEEHKPLIKAGRIGSVYFVKGAAASNEAQRIAVEESRLKIPLLVGFDVIHGYRTIFPIPLAESCSWDLELIEKSAHIAAREARAAGVHWAFAPMVDIARDPRWGRIAEGAGEDTYLGSLVAAARIRGFQGIDIGAQDRVAACVKHYAGYGAAEGGRDYNTTEISERTLREVYLPPFKAAIDAGSASVMSSFNDMNGLPSSANEFLLKKVLRDEWKFNDVLLSDYDAIGELIKHGISGNQADAAKESISIGLDMDMESGAYMNNLAQLVRDKKISEKLIDESVRRVLRLKARLGLFKNPYANIEREKIELLSKENLDHALEVARRSIVLLKNEKDILPLSKAAKTIAVIGPLADNKVDPLGCWSCDGKQEDVVSVLVGIRSKAPNAKILYAKGCEIEGDSMAGLAAAVEVAKQADIVIMAMGESAKMSGEAASRAFLDLSGKQEELVREIHKLGKPVVLVLMNGRPLAIEWAQQNVAAIVEAWHLGTQTGSAIADVLFGDYNPSGRLTTSFPRAVGQVPVNYNHKNTGRPTQSKYLDLPQTPLYPFGFGLSYTTFSYSNLRLNTNRMSRSGKLTVSVDVQNTGKRAGEETVQLYVRDLVASVTRPVKELKGFVKIMLQPGETKTAAITLSAEQLRFFDREMRFTVEPGMFKVWAGPNSAEGLETEFEVTGE